MLIRAEGQLVRLLGSVRSGGGSVLLLAPAAIFLSLLFIRPLWGIGAGAVDGGRASASKIWDNLLFGMVVENTLIVSAITTVVATIVAYVLAVVAWRSAGVLRLVVFAFVLLPFWTPVMVKNFAWIELLRTHGVIDDLFGTFGIGSGRVELLHNRLAVIIGMVHYTIPYAVFPIFAAMLPLDQRLERAADSLGANRWRRWYYVIIPLTLPGILAAAMLVFIISVGFFITPVILGGPADLMIANLIDYYERELVDFETASMLAVFVTLAVSALVVIYQRIPREGQYGRA